MKLKTTIRDGIEYEIRRGKCKSPNIRFDAHAGFAICQVCGWDTHDCGPDGMMFMVDKTTGNMKRFFTGSESIFRIVPLNT